MKLKEGFVTQEIGGRQVMVAVNGEAFNGMVRSNETAGYIVSLLKNDTTKEEIVKAMLREFDASEEQVSKDVDMVITKLREIGAILD
uniref:Coenzyme PQQ synthesis protein D (PqqD) n=1 Tax=Eubacterium cellulosolvens (strain ATCC 43171 / JCM 9499 / 6) TaxID=633697 RepID=I5AUZ4_EUBC6